MTRPASTLNLDGQALRRLRERQALSLRELSELSGVTFGNIAKLERGEHRASTKTIFRLAKGLGVEVDDIAVAL